MAYDTESFTLSKDAVEATSETVSRVLGRLSPIPRVKRRVYDSPNLVLMVVTETQNLSDYGLGAFENVAIDGVFQSAGVSSGPLAFRAKVYTPGITNLSKLADDDDIWIDPTLIPTALITGQLFMMSSTAITQKGTTVSGRAKDTGEKAFTGSLAGGVVTAGIGNRWYGRFRSAPFGNVDLSFTQAVANDKAQLDANYCRIAAVNQTGITLTDKQGVRVDYMARGVGSFQGQSGATGGSPGQWAITDYSCSTGTGVLTS